MIKSISNKISRAIKYFYYISVNKGAYNFLLKKVLKSTDINFLEQVWALDYFRESLVPQEIDIKTLDNVLVLAPHQDDEVIGCGGLLYELAKNNKSITIGFITNGSELSNPISSIKTRKLEGEKVAKQLGAKVVFIDVDNVSLNIEPKHNKALKELLNENWSGIFSIWPLDWPPKHRLCAYWVGKIINELKYKGVIYFYSVHTELLPNYYFDITENITFKEKLIENYQSQLKDQNYGHLSKSHDGWKSRYLNVSQQARYIETFMKIPSKSYADFIQLFDRADSLSLLKEHVNSHKSFLKLKSRKYFFKKQ